MVTGAEPVDAICTAEPAPKVKAEPESAVIVSLVIWTATLVYIYAAVKTTAQFFVMAAIVAVVLGWALAGEQLGASSLIGGALIDLVAPAAPVALSAPGN